MGVAAGAGARVVRTAAVAAAIAAAIGCSANQPTPGSHGVATPLQKAAPREAAQETAAAEQAEPLALDQFAPLLADPALAEVQKSLEAGRARVAATQIKAAMAKTPPAEADVKRWQFLLARVLERAGDLKGAAASYDLAAGHSWPLAGYAKLGAGRVLLRAGQHVRALERLRAAPGDLAVVDEVRLLKAEAAYHAGEPALAIDVWRKHLASEEAPDDWMLVSLSLANALLSKKKSDDGGAAKPTEAELAEALRLARRVRIEAARMPKLRGRATALEHRALAKMAPAQRKSLEKPSASDDLLRLSVLVGARQDDAAEDAADALLKRLPARERWSDIGCEAVLLRGKAIAMKRERGRAADSLSDALVHCKKDDDRRARLLYLAGKYAALDGRHAQAVKRYATLEKELPGHRLADDARMRAAFSYYEMGTEARFTELLSSMPEDYPDGDMVLDGVFRLGMRRWPP